MAEGMSKQEILVKLRADARDMVNSFKEARNTIKSQMARIQKDIDSIRFTQKGTRRKKFSKEEKEHLERLRVKYKKLGTELKSMSAKQGHAMTNMRANINKVRKDIDATKKSAKGLEGAMLGASLSMMFAGMAMRQAALSVWRTSTKTFQDVAHSVDGSVTQFDLLRGSLKYLQFSVGSALEPLAARLIPIVDGITSVVQQNPGLFRIAVAFGAVAGSVLMVLGQLGSFVFGLRQISKLTRGLSLVGPFRRLGTYMKGISLVKPFRRLGTYMKGLSLVKPFRRLGTYVSGGLLTDIKNLGGFLKTSVKSNIQWIKKNPIKSVMGGLVLTGIIMAFAWLNRLQKSMGGWDELLRNAGRGFLRMGAIFAATISAITVKAVDMWNSITGKGTSGYSFRDVYSKSLQDNLQKIEEDFGKPEKGYIDESRSLGEIWRGEIYPAVEDVKNDMQKAEKSAKSIGNNMSSEATHLSMDEVTKAWEKGYLDSNTINDLLVKDHKNESTLTDETESFLKDLYQQNTGREFKLSLDAAASENFLAGKIVDITEN